MGRMPSPTSKPEKAEGGCSWSFPIAVLLIPLPICMCPLPLAMAPSSTSFTSLALKVLTCPGGLSWSLLGGSFVWFHLRNPVSTSCSQASGPRAPQTQTPPHLDTLGLTLINKPKLFVLVPSP